MCSFSLNKSMVSYFDWVLFRLRHRLNWKWACMVMVSNRPDGPPLLSPDCILAHSLKLPPYDYLWTLALSLTQPSRRFFFCLFVFVCAWLSDSFFDVKKKSQATTSPIPSTSLTLSLSLLETIRDPISLAFLSVDWPWTLSSLARQHFQHQQTKVATHIRLQNRVYSMKAPIFLFVFVLSFFVIASKMASWLLPSPPLLQHRLNRRWSTSPPLASPRTMVSYVNRLRLQLLLSPLIAYPCNVNANGKRTKRVQYTTQASLSLHMTHKSALTRQVAATLPWKTGVLPVSFFHSFPVFVPCSYSIMFLPPIVPHHDQPFLPAPYTTTLHAFPWNAPFALWIYLPIYLLFLQPFSPSVSMFTLCSPPPSPFLSSFLIHSSYSSTPYIQITTPCSVLLLRPLVFIFGMSVPVWHWIPPLSVTVSLFFGRHQEKGSSWSVRWLEVGPLDSTFHRPMCFVGGKRGVEEEERNKYNKKTRGMK